MNKVTVSVIVACRNLEKYLPECIESIQAQTFEASEIIIVHDGCDDLSQCYPGATNVLRTLHCGVARTREEGVLLAKGENILFVDADDVLSENFIELMVKKRIESKAQIIYPNVLLWSHWHETKKLQNGWRESPPEITTESMMEMNQIVVSSMIPRKLYLDLGGMPDVPMLEDYAFWLKAVYAGATFAKCQAYLKYRQREGSRNRQSDKVKNQMYFDIREKYAKS